MSITVELESEVIHFQTWEQFSRWGTEYPDIPLKKVIIDQEIHIPRNDCKFEVPE